MNDGNLDYDIVIVGLGPVGAVAANLAGLLGFRTLVVERSAQPYLKPRAIVFDAEVMRIFDSIGLAQKIAATTRPLGGSIYLGADGEPIRTFRARPPASKHAWFPSNLFFQPELEGILRSGIERFPNVSVKHEHEVTALLQDGAGVQLTLTANESIDGQSVTARTVLACDGASSTIRKSLDIPLDDIGFEERWLVVDTFVHGPMRWPETHAVPIEVRDGLYSLMVCDPERPATLIPGVGLHRRWEYMMMPGENVDDEIPDEWLRGLLAQWVDPADVELIRSAVYRFRALIATRWREGAVFLVGDAAHQTPPFFGQGMCHGIRDAAQLMWKLRLVRDGVSSPEMLSSYQVEREPHVRSIISASVDAGSAVCKLDPEDAAARDVKFRMIEAERLLKPVAMTDIVPPLSDGIVDMRTGGMRVPEFAFDTNAGIRRIDDLIGHQFLLLGLDDLPPTDSLEPLTVRSVTVGPVSGVCDKCGSFASWLRDHSARWTLIRPDRYVFALGSTDADFYAAAALLRAQLTIIDGVPERAESQLSEISVS